MKRICDGFEESIWECARTGRELSEEARRHIESCKSCARVLEDAGALAGPLVDAGHVSDGPDCRAAVMARISSGTRRWVPAWAYACAVVVIGAVTALGMMTNRPQDTARAPVVVKKTVTSPKKAPAPLPVPKIAQKSQQRPLQIVKAPARVHHMRIVAIKHARIAAPPTPNPPTPVTQPPTPATRSVAAVYVTWPEANEPAEQSYSYVEHNAETGETTNCSVKRSGDRVEIYMESTPGGEKPPVEGSIEDESKINA